MLNLVRLPGQTAAVRNSPTGCGLLKCCPCVNFSFLKTTVGILKILEAVGGSVCQTLLISNDFAFSMVLGTSYYSFLTTASACMMTSFILLLSYLISSQTLSTVRKSYFEILFNAFGAFLYLTSSCYLAMTIHTILYPYHKIASLFQAYPSTSTTYILGFSLSAIHLYDAYLAYRSS